jgi:hypothetical protein
VPAATADRAAASRRAGLPPGLPARRSKTPQTLRLSDLHPCPGRKCWRQGCLH